MRKAVGAVAGVALVAVLGAGALIRQSAGGAARADAGVSHASPATAELRSHARPSGERVVVAAFDALDWVLLDRLIAEGRCPTFARMKRSGAWGEVVSREPVLSPLIWTTIATGRPPEAHGILDFVTIDAATGKPVPISNQSRKVHAFWNIMSSAGLSVNVVNWWATYPAEGVNGVMVSDRLFSQLPGVRPSPEGAANVHPRELSPEVDRLLVDPGDVGFEEVKQYAEVTRGDFDRAVAQGQHADNRYDDRLSHLRKIVAVTRGVFNVSRWLLDSHPADLTAFYVEGTDTVGHRFAHFLPPRLGWVAADDFAAYSDTMARYYQECDRQLGELMDHSPPDTTWVVVSDHGFLTGDARPSVPPDDFTFGAPHWHRLVGVLLASGPHVRQGKVPRVSIDDLCRTLLWLVGAPVAADLEGTQLVEMMQPEWVEAHPVAEVPSYEQLPRTWIMETPPSLVDDARLAELEALGYVQREADRTPVAQGTAPSVRVTDPYNRAQVALERGDLAEAERGYLEAIEMEPGFALAMTSLADLYRQQGRHDKSLLWILRALETGSSLVPEKTLLDLVEETKAVGAVSRVLETLEAIRPRWEKTATFHAARGRALLALRRLDEAEAELRSALELDPADPVATEELLALAAGGRNLNTQAILLRALAAAGNDIDRLNGLALACLRQKRPALAEKLLTKVLASNPNDPAVVNNLAVALGMQGKASEVASLLERSLASGVDDARLRLNYATALASLDRPEEALAQVEAAERLGERGPAVALGKAGALARLGRVEAARAVLEEAARRFPDHPGLREQLAKLKTN